MPGPIRTASAAASLAFAVAPIPFPARSHAAKPDRRPGHKVHLAAPGKQWTSDQPTIARHDVRVQLKAQPKQRRQAHHKPQAKLQPKAHRHSGPRAHTAGDPGDTISDFKFSPGTTAVHVGDTITWTNSGPSPHTATARDGSFDTGNLAKGASASHTFTHSGTFAYICTIHPFMHGTVVVLAAAGPPASSGQTPTAPSAVSPSTPSAAGTPSATPAPTQAHAPTLPVTGISVLAIISVGLALLSLGWLVRGAGTALAQKVRLLM